MAISVMFYGLGPIGAAVARDRDSQGFKIAAASIIDPAKSGESSCASGSIASSVKVSDDAAGGFQTEEA
jgi:hypothetical protein